MRKMVSAGIGDGARILECQCGEPGPVYAARGELYAYVPTPLVLRLKDGRRLAGAGYGRS